MKERTGFGSKRSAIEHRIISDKFFEDPAKFTETMLREGESMLLRFYNGVLPGRYGQEQFKVEALPNTLGGKSLVIKLPEPDDTLACTCIGTVCAEDGSQPEYYTVNLNLNAGFYLGRKVEKRSREILPDACGESAEEHIQALRRRLRLQD